MNRTADRILQDVDEPKCRDWSKNLAGSHRAELHITDLFLENFDAQKFLLTVARIFFDQASNQFVNIKQSEDSKSGALKIRIQNVWINEMTAGDFNPLHHHPNCDLSCVGFLETPEGYEQELCAIASHKKVAGYLQFVDGRPSFGAASMWQIRPIVGDFYIFPSWLMHCVYPFRSAGVRRSFSANLILDLQRP